MLSQNLSGKFIDTQGDVLYAPYLFPQDMAQLGADFGAYFWAPLIKDAGYRITTAVLGPRQIGKSTFGINAVRSFAEFYTYIEGECGGDFNNSNLQDEFLATAATRERELHFHWKDFGHSFSNEAAKLRDPSMAGLDYFEHPPVSLLPKAQIVILFGTYGRDGGYGRPNDLGKYYAGDETGLYLGVNPGQVAQETGLVNAHKIALEMRKMRYHANSRKEVRIPYEERERCATFILTGREVAMREAFDNFRVNAQATRYNRPAPKP